MKREQILNVFKSLAMSQGFYGRLLRDIRENEEWGENFLASLEGQNFGSELDLILAIES